MRLALGALGLAVLLATPAPAGEIHHYASAGKAAQVEALLRGGVSPDKADDEGRTPLYFAAVNEHPDVVRLLLDKGADPNIPTPEGRILASWVAWPEGVEQPRAPRVPTRMGLFPCVDRSCNRSRHPLLLTPNS